MSVQAPVPKDSAMFKAWLAYQETDGFANSLRWLARGSPTEGKGEMWAAFVAGWEASNATGAEASDGREGPQLLPCPFCGGEPYVHEPDFHGDSYQIGCECDGSEDGCWRDGRTLAEAVFRWNERHPGGPDG